MKILNDTTGDSATVNTWLDILLDDTDSNSSCVAPDEDTINTQVNAMPDTPTTQPEFACLPFIESDFPQIPVDLRFSQYRDPNGGDTFSDILNGGYIELKNLIPSIEELDHHDSCLWELESQGNWSPSKL